MPKKPLSSLSRLAGPWLAACLCLLPGCQREGEKATVLAQVGSSALTLEELRESFPAEYEQLIKPRAVPGLHQALDRRRGHLPAGPKSTAGRGARREAQAGQAPPQAADRGVPGAGKRLRGLRARRNGHEPVLRNAQGGLPPQGAGNQVRPHPPAAFEQAADVRAAFPGENFLALAGDNSLDPTPESMPPWPPRRRTSCPLAWPRTWPRPVSGRLPPP